MDRITHEAVNIRKLMREAEGVTDEGIIALAKLKTAMVSARRAPGVNVSAGQKAIMCLNRAEQNITAAYTDLLRVHAQLSDLAIEYGMTDEDIPTVIKGLAELQPEVVLT